MLFLTFKILLFRPFSPTAHKKSAGTPMLSGLPADFANSFLPA